MSHVRILLAVGLVLVLGSSICRAQPAVGDKPKLSFKAVDGTQIDLEKLRGKMVLIDFWASWCGPCMDEADHLLQINRQYGPNGLVLIGINMDSSARSMVAVCQQKGFNWPQYFDGMGWGNRIAKAWGVSSIPATFLISPDGELLWKGHSARLDPVLVEAFQAHPPQLVKPEVLQAANAAMDKAEALLAESKPAEALKALAVVDESARKDKAYDARAQAMQEKLLAHGQSVLAETETMVADKQYAVALTRLKELQHGFKGTPIADQARERLAKVSANPDAKAALAAAEKETRAAEALALAEKLRAEEKHEEAYGRLKALAKDAPGTPAAETAATLVAEYEKDPAFVKKAMEKTSGDKARAALSMAQSYARNGRHDTARTRYQQIMTDYPGTSWADQAKQEMEKLPK